MVKFYSKVTNGFYSPEINGSKMPPDVVEISEVVYKKLLADQSTGKIIIADLAGKPISVVPPELSDIDLIKKQIRDLEKLQTPRRIRESFVDDSWIKEINTQIMALRALL